jgi:hypothetical protein
LASNYTISPGLKNISGETGLMDSDVIVSFYYSGSFQEQFSVSSCIHSMHGSYGAFQISFVRVADLSDQHRGFRKAIAVGDKEAHDQELFCAFRAYVCLPEQHLTPPPIAACTLSKTAPWP